MGAIIQGKEYREATCITCGFKWKTDESTEHGLHKDDVTDLKKMGHKYKVGDDLCIGCYLKFCEDDGRL
jgi:hypothetical protein